VQTLETVRMQCLAVVDTGDINRYTILFGLIISLISANVAMHGIPVSISIIIIEPTSLE